MFLAVLTRAWGLSVSAGGGAGEGSDPSGEGDPAGAEPVGEPRLAQGEGGAHRDPGQEGEGAGGSSAQVTSPPAYYRPVNTLFWVSDIIKSGP